MSMNILWIVIGSGLFVILVLWMAMRRHRGRASDLGFVSDRWQEEHRLSETSGH